MKIQTFQSLQAIIAMGSMAKAAQSLGLTPSAISMQIKHLEAYMGASLFERSGQSLKPNALALELSQVMDHCWQRVEALRQARDIQVKGIVRLGIVDTLSPLVLPRTLAKLQSLHPQLQVKASRGKSKWLQQQVRSGDLELAVLAQPQALPTNKSLVWHPLMEREFILVAPPDSQGSIQQLLSTHRVIAYDRSTVTGAMAAQYLEKVHAFTRAEMEFDSIPSILSMVSLGLGVSVLQVADTRLLQVDPVRCLALGKEAPTIQYAALVKQDNQEKRNVQALLAVLQAVATPAGQAN